jgi:DNA repair photolyase
MRVTPMAHRDTDVEGQVMLPPKPLAPTKGRGAVSNLQGRYERHGRESFDDGWLHEDGEAGDEAAAPFKTRVTDEYAKTILSRNASPDIPFSVSLNPYRGCEHGCIYCFARPTHSYLGLSPGLDFESRLFAKVNAADLLRRELARPAYVPQPIAVGVNTDAYQPCERTLGLTRGVLEVLEACHHPAGFITKSALIERDIDLLGAMAARRQACVAITLTPRDPAISRTLAPRAKWPGRAW